MASLQRTQASRRYRSIGFPRPPRWRRDRRHFGCRQHHAAGRGSVAGAPTVAGSGVPGYEVVGWSAMFAPAGTPMAIVEKLSAEARRGLQRPEFARMAEA